MALPFTPDEYRWLINRLAALDEVLTPEAQKAFIRTAFYGSPRIDDISSRQRYSYQPRQFVIFMFEFFGSQIQEDIPGRKTASVVLREMLNLVGEESDAGKLRSFLSRYYPETPSPIATPPAAVIDIHRLDDRFSEFQSQLAAMEAERRSDLNLVLWAIAQSQTSSQEALLSAQELQNWSSQVLTESSQLNAQLREQIQTLISHSATANQYLMASVPIIPGILSYNYEIGTQHALDLKSIFERIKGRFRPSSKDGGSGKSTPQPVINSGQARGVFAGVNAYDDEAISSLRYPAADMTALSALLAPRYQAARLLADGHDVLPTRANILRELAAQAEAAEEGDLLLCAFSGHGTAMNGESYLLVRDTAYVAQRDTALPLSAVLKLINDSPARAKVLILDACHAGAQIGKAPLEMTEEFIQRVFEQAAGTAVIASSRQNQVSWEAPDLNHGVFTYYLLEALSGRADFDGKGFVTVLDAYRYVSGMVKAWAANRGRAQNPTLQYTVDGDIVMHRYA